MTQMVVYDANFGKWWFKLENGILKLLLRTRLKLGSTYILSVKGRKTGAIHSTPVVLVEVDSERYLVAPYGPVNWVRNARAAGSVTLTRGRRSEVLRIAEIEPDESASILKKYVQIAPATRSCFHVKPDSPVQDFVVEAPGHPVFRLVE
ncbi:MAG TPA: nitroreductase family deazaflavin-dependent oxidoreductase [Chloroflexota bacterium]